MLQLIAILRGPTSYNARRLAERFGCSIRNIHRDIAVLELAGVPLYHDPDYGQGGGYRIRSDWFFPQVGLSDSECVDLAIISTITESHAIPLLDNVSVVRDKLLQTLPPKQADLIFAAAELFDVLGLQLADHSHCRDVMTTIQAALLAGKQIKAVYRSPHEKKVVRSRLQPLRVILSGQAWYLVAHDCSDARVKLYRVARFQRVEMLPQAIDIDRSFSIREFLGNAWTVHRGDGRDWHVEIEFSPDVAEIMAETKHHPTQEIEYHKDGSAVFRATVSGLDEIQWWVLGFGPRAKVLKPKELQQRVHDLLKQAVKRYPTNSKGNKV